MSKMRMYKSTGKKKTPVEPPERVQAVREYLEREVWPQIPRELRGKKFTKREREEILGIGPDGHPL
jgi:hypothetical protein